MLISIFNKKPTTSKLIFHILEVENLPL